MLGTNSGLFDDTFCVYLCVILEDVFVLRKKNEKNPEIFGLFSTTRWVRSHVSLNRVMYTFIFCLFWRTATWMLIFICFFHSVLSLKDMQCACITWKTSVQRLMGLLHTGNELTTTGRCTMAGSPTRDLDRWVIFAPSVALSSFYVRNPSVQNVMAIWRPTWVNVEEICWKMFGSYIFRCAKCLMADESIFSMTVHITILLERIMTIL